jgi:hypothetical protein
VPLRILAPLIQPGSRTLTLTARTREVPGRLEAAPSAEDEALPALLISETEQHEQAGRIPAGSSELIVATRVQGHTVVHLAAGRGVSAHGLVQRRRRAEQQLRHRLAVA